MFPVTTTLDPIRVAIAAEIRAEMARQDRSQNELAELLDLKAPVVSTRMRGRRSWRAEELLRVAHWLGVPVSQFYPPQDTLPN